MLIIIVNELSTTIDIESTLVRAEALFRRYQRTIEAIDKKSNFPVPSLRQRQPVRNASIGGAQSLQSPNSPNPVSQGSNAAAGSSSANSSRISVVTAGSTNSGAVDKGKRKVSGEQSRESGEMVDQRPKVISPELRGLLSRKVEILPRKIVRKEGEGLSSLAK